MVCLNKIFCAQSGFLFNVNANVILNESDGRTLTIKEVNDSEKEKKKRTEFSNTGAILIHP